MGAEERKSLPVPRLAALSRLVGPTGIRGSTGIRRARVRVLLVLLVLFGIAQVGQLVLLLVLLDFDSRIGPGGMGTPSSSVHSTSERTATKDDQRAVYTPSGIDFTVPDPMASAGVTVSDDGKTAASRDATFFNLITSHWAVINDSALLDLVSAQRTRANLIQADNQRSAYQRNHHFEIRDRYDYNPMGSQTSGYGLNFDTQYTEADSFTDAYISLTTLLRFFGSNPPDNAPFTGLPPAMPITHADPGSAVPEAGGNDTVGDAPLLPLPALAEPAPLPSTDPLPTAEFLVGPVPVPGIHDIPIISDPVSADEAPVQPFPIDLVPETLDGFAGGPVVPDGLISLLADDSPLIINVTDPFTLLIGFGTEDGFGFFFDSISVVPEPTSLILLGAGALILVRRERKPRAFDG